MEDRVPPDLTDLPVEGHGRGIRYDAWRAKTLERALLFGCAGDSLVIVEAPPIRTDGRGLVARTDRVHVVRDGVVRTHSHSFRSRDEIAPSGEGPTVLERVCNGSAASFTEDLISLDGIGGRLSIECPFAYRNGRLERLGDADRMAFEPRQYPRTVAAVASRIDARGHLAMSAVGCAGIVLLFASLLAFAKLVVPFVETNLDPIYYHLVALLGLALATVFSSACVHFASRAIERLGTPATPAFPLSGGLSLGALSRGTTRLRRIEVDEARFAKPRVSWRGVVRLPKEVLVLMSDGSSAYMRADDALAQVARP